MKNSEKGGSIWFNKCNQAIVAFNKLYYTVIVNIKKGNDLDIRYIFNNYHEKINGKNLLKKVAIILLGAL